jgi:hypothetical protein
MKRRLLGTFVWFFSLLVAGLARIVWLTLRAAASHPWTFLALATLYVALSQPNPVTEQLPLDLVWPLGHVMWSWLSPLLGAGVLFHGTRTPWVWNIRRWLWHHGW